MREVVGLVPDPSDDRDVAGPVPPREPGEVRVEADVVVEGKGVRNLERRTQVVVAAGSGADRHDGVQRVVAAAELEHDEGAPGSALLERARGRPSARAAAP